VAPYLKTLPTNALGLGQWFLTWGKFTPGGKFHFPRGKLLKNKLQPM